MDICKKKLAKLFSKKKKKLAKLAIKNVKMTYCGAVCDEIKVIW